MTFNVPLPRAPTATTPLVEALVSLRKAPPAPIDRVPVSAAAWPSTTPPTLLAMGADSVAVPPLLMTPTSSKNALGTLPPVQLLAEFQSAVPGGNQRMSNARAIGAPIPTMAKATLAAIARQSLENSMM